MAGFADDVAKQRLAALNETQEGIVGVAQWFLFHKRHAERIVQLWYDQVNTGSASKRLNLIYLANELAQQSKSKKRDEFLNAFSPVIPDATALAYKSASNDVQTKLRRVLEVWRQRSIFAEPTQDAIEARIDALDKDKSSSRRPLFSNASLFSQPAVPAELSPLVALHASLSKAELALKPALAPASAEYTSLIDAPTSTPSPPVHAAKLSALLKTLSNAESALSESLRAREELIGTLTKILASHQAKAGNEKEDLAVLRQKRVTVEEKKRSVEDAIMNGLLDEPDPYPNGDVQRPEVEELTPPPAGDDGPLEEAVDGPLEETLQEHESDTPPGSPPALPLDHAPQQEPPQPQPALSAALSVLASTTSQSPPPGLTSGVKHTRPPSEDGGRGKRRREEEGWGVELDDDTVGMIN